jgi:hypothetical protein
MEKLYTLRSIRIAPSTDYLSVTASLFLGARRVGTLSTCPDTEAIELAFALPTDRLVFESFITAWWEREDRTVHFDLTERAMHDRYPDCQPALMIKMRCWVRSIVRPAAKKNPLSLAAA